MYQSADHINVKCEKLQQLFVVSVTSRLHVVSPFTIHGSCRSGNKVGPKKVPFLSDGEREVLLRTWKVRVLLPHDQESDH